MKTKRLLALLLALCLFLGDAMPLVTAVGESLIPSAPTQVVYDFNIHSHSDNLGTGNFSLEDPTSVDYLENLYDTGAINWLYEGKTNGNSKADGSGVETQHSRNQHYSGGIRMYSNGHGWWYAIRIKSPGTGTYQVTVNSDTAVGNGLTKHSIWTETYLFDAAGVDAGTTTIAESLTAANKMNDFKPTSTETDVALGAYTFEAGKEYILVFNETYDIYSEGRDGFDTNNLYFKSLTLNWQAQSEGPVVEEKYYDFGLPADTTLGIVNGGGSSFSVDDQKDAVKALYDAGTIDWAYEGRVDGNAKSDNSGEVRAPRANTFYKSNYYKNGYGLYLKDHGSVSYNGWYAIRLRAPGVGKYSVTINSALPPENGGNLRSRWADVYMFDASLLTGNKTVADFLTSAYAKDRFAPTLTELDCTVGEVEFVSDTQEYILVFHLTIDARNANKDNRAEHLALNGLTLNYIQPDPEESTGATTTVGTTTEETTTGPVEITGPVMGYNFGVYANYRDFLASGNSGVTDSADALAEMYEKGLIDWLPVGHGGLDEGSSPINRNQWQNNQIQVYSIAHNWYYAIKFRAPGTGTYDFTVNTATVTSGEVQKHSIWTEAYIAEDGSYTNVADVLNDEHKIKGFKPTSDAPDAYIGNVAFDENKEYVLILRETIDTRRDGHRDGLSTDNLYLKGFTFEAAEPPAVDKTGYDFDLLTNYPDDFNAGKTSVDDQKAKIENFFNNGYIDWMFYGKQNGSKTGAAGEELVNSFSQNALSKGRGFQVYGTGMHGWWYGIKFRSKVTGTADITLNTFLVKGSDDSDKHSLWTEAYLIESSELKNKSVDDLLDADHKIKRFAPTVENPAAYLGNVTLESGKEYIIVLKSTLAMYQQSKKTGTQNLYLSDLSVVAADPPPVEKTGYDFDLLGNYPDDFVSGKNSVMEQKKKIDEFYEKGYISWRVEAILNGSKTGDVENEEPINAFSQNALSKGNGIQVYSGAGHNWVYAFRIQSPGKGYHKVTMGTFLTEGKDADGNPVKKHSIWTDVYIIEASMLDNGKITLRDAMLKKYKLGNFEPTVENTDAYIGTYNFEEGKEYIIFFRETMKHWQKVKNIGGTLNMYLKGFAFEYTGKPDTTGIDPNKTVYDFDLAHKENGIYTGSPTLDAKKDDVSRLYGLDDLNWKLEENATGGSSKYSGLGITCYSGADGYLVFRIKSPGKGLHTLTLNHGKSGRAGTGAVYVLPVSDVDNAIDATDIHNRVGRVNFYNDTGDVNPTSGYTSLLGTWEFGSASEYLVVIEAYAACPIDVATSYMYINQLVCEKGDVTSKYQAEKRVNSMLISDGPVNTLDTCPYKAAGEVNGHDYFYLPLEGKKMNVYDIDAKEFVAQVDTPFTTCRGVVVDKEGIVWAVGDNPYIWRYDPFLNVAEDVYYYKGFEGGQKGDNKVIGGYSGQDIILGDDGALYFGVAMGGWFARYEPDTGKFTNLGTIGGDSANWSCSPIYYKGNLFGTVTGDRDGDGTKTTTLIKMEATTGDVIATMDLTPYLNQGEVMTRGGGICGGVLLFGGDQNDKIKNVVAIDAETLEFIDLGIYGQISSGITNELDGKVYFTAQGIGVFEFDGATRTATKLELSDAFSLPMVCHDNSFVTVEGNEKFPGYSILTYRTGTSQPVVLNPQTLEFMVIDGLVSDDHGTGNSILSIAAGITETDKNNLYIGVFNNQACSVLDIATGEVIHKYETNGQTDTMCFYNGNLYVGNYNQGALVQINMDDKRRNVTLFSLKTEYHQARIHNVVAGDGKVFVGSIPDWYQYGGCLAWIDINTLEKHVERHVVKDQSIIGLAYHDGIIYGGSAAGGGTGATPIPGASAKVFLYDVENKQKIMELDPREFLSDMPETVKGVSGLIPDPEVEKNGIIWGIAGGTLFTIKYDKATGKVTTEEKLCFDKTEEGSGWKETGMQMVDGYLYVNMGSKGGVRKVNIRNVADNTVLPIAKTDIFNFATDGNIYYAVTDNLYMYPMNIQDSDWAAADAVDKLLEAIPKVITLEHEAQLLEAEEAYNALTWTQKALVQKLYKLQDAKIEFLECRIDSIGEVTLDDIDLIFEIKNTYNAMTVKDRSYVKNFRTVFVPAMQALQKLQDAEAAAKVQALIDTIPGMGEITLEKEPAIREIEAAYLALTKDQRALVDATALENALETIKALRQVRIDRLIALINGLGETITLADEPAITEAMEIYNWLTMDERELVDYQKLITANGQLQKLQKAAAAEVDALIEAIGDTVDYSSGDAIKAARAAYDALTPGSKQYVKLLAILEEAEALYETLFPIWAIIVIAVVAVGAVAAAVVVVLKKKKSSKPAKETAPVSDET